MPGRRTVSIRAASYARLLAHAGQNGRTVSDLVEQQIAALFGEPWPPPTRGEPLEVTPPAEIGDGTPAHSRYSAIPTGKERPRALDIPEGRLERDGSGRPAPTAARTSPRPPIGNVRTF